MSEKFYAASSAYGLNATYSSGGWDVHVFSVESHRDAWVNEYHDRKVITEAEANKISPQRAFEVDNRFYHLEDGSVIRDNGSGEMEELTW